MTLKSLVIIIMSLLLFTATAFSHPEGDIVGLINIQGLLYCTPDGNTSANGSATQVFPGAQVQLQCGRDMVSSTKTNETGKFEILLNPIQYLLPTLLSNCNLVVSTPLSTCDTTLPDVGGLVSTLTFVGNSFNGFLVVANLIPAGFQYIPSI